MKEIIEEYYLLKVIGFIRVSHLVYKVKCEDALLYLKLSDDSEFTHIVDYIESVHLKCFVGVLRNKDQQVLTPYRHQYFYLMESLEENNELFKEIRIKCYFEMLAYIHSQSCYCIKVNKEYFKQIYKDCIEIINERVQYYNQIMLRCEKHIYRSPSEWLFILNYYRIDQCLNYAKMYLKKYMDSVNHKNSIRVSLVYKHFEYDHILLKSKKLISIDKMKIDMPIFDIYDVYSRLPDILFDLDCLSNYYLKTMCFDDDEKILLCCLLNIAPVIYLENNEINNIIKISRLLYYIDSIQSLCKQLDSQKQGEIH